MKRIKTILRVIGKIIFCTFLYIGVLTLSLIFWVPVVEWFFEDILGKTLPL